MEHIDSKLETLIAEWQQLQPLKLEDQKRLNSKFRLEFNYNSNHLEGNTLTYGETKLLLLFDQTKGNHDMREYEEMKAHDVALKMVEQEAADKERPLTENFIRTLNATILVRPFWKDAITPDGQDTRRLIEIGEYKKYPNSVRQANGEIFEYASPQETPALMSDLAQWYNSEVKKGELTAVELAALLHYKYIRIHPFDDGNGRVARLLVNYVLQYNNLPPIIIKTDKKKDYLRALQQADAGDRDAFIHYMKEQLYWSLSIAVQAGKGESIEETGDIDKEIDVLKRKVISKHSITKHPQIIYDIFTDANNRIWKNLVKEFSKFDSLFGESKEYHQVNYMDEKYETITQSVFDLSLKFKKEVSMAPPSIKIFGYNIYDTDIHTIYWKQINYGLKSTKRSTNFDLGLLLKFDTSEYHIMLSINQINIVHTTMNYGDFILLTDIENMNKSLANNLLNQIKEQIDDKA